MVCRSGWANFRTEEGTESLEKLSLLFICVFNYLFQFLPPKHSFFTGLFPGWIEVLHSWCKPVFIPASSAL